MAVRQAERDESAVREPLRRVGVRELKERTSEVVRRVREERESVDITFHGEVVARIVPTPSSPAIVPTLDRVAREERWQELSREKSRLWPEEVSAVEAVSEGRSRLEQPPPGRPTIEDRLAREERRRLLGEEMSKKWPEGVSAVDAIRDVRDDGW